MTSETEKSPASGDNSPASGDKALETAVSALHETLSRAAFSGGRKENAWEGCASALAILLGPMRRTYEIAEAMPATATPMDRISVLNALASLGHFSRESRATPRGIDPRLLPCLFAPDGAETQPFVILRHDNGAPRIFDGFTAQPLSQNTAGTAWFFSPYDQSRQRASRFMRGGTGHSWFRALVGRFHGAFAQVMIAGLALNIVALASPLYMMAVYDLVVSPANHQALMGLAAGVSIAIASEWALRRVRSRGLSWLSARLDSLVGNKIFAHLIGLPPEMIEQASVSAQVARIRTFESVRDLFSGAVFLSFLEIPYVVLALAAIAAVAGPLAFVPLAMSGAYMILFLAMRREIKAVIRLAAKAGSARQQFTIEALEKMAGIRANGLTAIWQKKFDDLTGQEIVMNFHLARLGSAAEIMAHALTLVSAVLTVGFGAHLIWAGAMSTGALIAAMMLVWRVLTPFHGLCSMIPRLEQLRNSVGQVNELMNLETEAEASRLQARLPRLAGRLSLSGVAFRYEGQTDPVFSTLTLDAAPGSLIALTGRSGAGKTSLLRLLKGLYRPENGSVRIDGFDLRQLDPVHLRRQVAYVPQKPDFFSASVADNLRFAHALASDQEMENALRLAAAWEEVQALGGTAAHLDPGAMPEGFAARLSLARAYLHGGAILLIDELPPAVMAGEAGRNLERYLQKSHGRRTAVIVTQRDAILESADLIVELRREAPPRYVGKTITLTPAKETA